MRRPNVGLRLINRADNVVLVRQAIAGLGAPLGLDAIELNDVTTAVTEACNNVVLHAYEGEAGPLEVELSAGSEGGLEVVVRDRGIGIRPRGDADAAQEAGGGIGLPVLHALAETVELREVAGGGTEVAMVFAGRRPSPFGGQADPDDRSSSMAAAGELDEDTTLLTLAPVSLTASVLPRVLTALAARAYFPTDRIADARQLAEGLPVALDGTIDCLSVSVLTRPHRLEMVVGPIGSAEAEAPALPDELAGALVRLAARSGLVAADDGAHLRLELTGERG